MAEKKPAGLLFLCSFSCTYLVNSTIMFAFKVVKLIFFVSADYESRKMWSKFDNGTLLMERDKKV